MKYNWTSMLAFLAAVYVAHAGDVSTKINTILPNRSTNKVVLEYNPRMQFFRDAKFGLFIHWGIYAVPAGQWGTKTNYSEWFQAQTRMSAVNYLKYAAQFNPTNFDAQQWINLATNAGIKYVVITAKHHDGFCMFDTTNTDYNVVKATPYAHDPMKDLADACKKDGVKLGFFYSLPDWHHPDMPASVNRWAFHGNARTNADFSKYLAYMRSQVKELLVNYGPVYTLWFDGGGVQIEKPNRGEVFDSEDMLTMIHQIQPDCLVNDRLGKGKDYSTVEGKIPHGYHNSDYEVCMKLNDHWGYNSADQNWKSAKTIIQNLTDVVSKGGNYMLDVGPRPDGSWPPPAVDILGQVGSWLKVNGESIYGTSRSPWSDVPVWGRVTAKDKCLFLHVFERPVEGGIRLVGLKVKPESAAFLADPGQGGQIGLEYQDGDTFVKLPAKLPDPSDSVVVLRFNEIPTVEDN